MLAKHGQDIDGTDGQKRPSHYTEDPSHDKREKRKCPGIEVSRTFPSSYVEVQKHGNDGRIKMRDFNSQVRRDETLQSRKRLDTQQLVDLINNEPMGRSHLIQEDRIKEEMLILNEPITFSYPAAWGMDQWEGPYVEYDSDVERSRTAEPPDLSRFVWVLFRGKGSSAAEPREGVVKRILARQSPTGLAAWRLCMKGGRLGG
ncbi:unnamed protein product [Microthlaspi erraticum]|uniref:Uncharacterized protein n=1 Tax=Microthlaspi erraticum TaxID=1685480 RepID=A0A6D2JW76_9BRAS|nr:unnamed protein product [Microthlaspi erraticum]